MAGKTAIKGGAVNFNPQTYTWNLRGKTITNVAVPQPPGTSQIPLRGVELSNLRAQVPGSFYWRKDPVTGRRVLYPWTSKTGETPLPTTRKEAKTYKSIADSLNQWQKDIESQQKAVNAAQDAVKAQGFQSTMDSLQLGGSRQQSATTSQPSIGFDFSSLLPLALVFGLLWFFFKKG